jgi:hypothetical protein
VQLVRVASAGVVTASSVGIDALYLASSDSEAVVCAAALTRLAQIAPCIQCCSSEQASAIISMASSKHSSTSTPGAAADAAQSVVVTWLRSELAALEGAAASMQCSAIIRRKERCEELERVLGLLRKHTDDAGLKAVAAALSLAAAVGADSKGVPFAV